MRPAPAPSPTLGQAPRDRDSKLARESHSSSVFLATVAHELRNAMAPLGAALELLVCGDGPTKAQALPVARRQLSHLTRLVEDMLDTGRVVNDQVELRLAPLDLTRFVEDAVASCRFAGAQRGHGIVMDLPSNPLWVNGDTVRLGQVLSNLLGNAIKFTPANGRITVRASSHGSSARISVSDNGIGIGQAEMESIFEMFTQDARGKALSRAGLGIGLSVARRLAELHGGTLSGHSAGTGHGSTFTLEVPLMRLPPSTAD